MFFCTVLFSKLEVMAFFFSCPSLLSDCASPVVNHPPTDRVKSGCVRFCCFDGTTLVELGLGLDVGVVLTDA